MSRIKVLLYSLSTMVLISSCKTTKISSTKFKVSKKNEEMVREIFNKSLDYNYLSMKANVTVINDGKKVSFKSSIRMKKDSVIWSSITFLGIAGARAIITTDSIKTVNYKDRNYVSESNTELSEKMKVQLLNLQNMQALLTGDLINLGDYDKYHVDLEGNHVVLSTLSDRKSDKEWIEKKLQKMEKKIEKKESKQNEKALERIEKKYEKRPDKFAGLDASIWVDTSLGKTVKIELIDYLLEGKMNVVYDEFEETEFGMMPRVCNISLEAEKRIEFNVVYSKITAPESLKMPFSIPKKYERVEL